MTMEHNFNFITDRLAIGNMASRSTPGFVAVVSVVTIEGRHRGRPWSAELTAKAPQVPGGTSIEGLTEALDINHYTVKGPTPVWIVDIADGEASGTKTAYSSTHEDDRDLDFYLDDATEFIAANIKRGCVLVHCGAGLSRSVAVVIAYLCRYAGMSYSEALSLVKARRPGAAPADCFKLAIERWLSLHELTTAGPRGFREMTSLSSIAQEIKATLTPFTQDQRDQILEFVFEELCKDCGGTWNGIDVEPAKRCRCIIW